MLNSIEKKLEEIFAAQSGDDLEPYNRNVKQHKRLSLEAERYIDLPPDEWPRLSFNWDLSTESQRFSLDAVNLNKFQSSYPEGFLIGWVDLNEFDAKLCNFSRRDGIHELWEEFGPKSIMANIIAYLANGLPISPPLVKPANDHEIIIQGGQHRYAAAKVTGVALIPIYVKPCDREAISDIVPVRWNDN